MQANYLKSARITVSVVREDNHQGITDTPERLHEYWRSVIAAQPDHEPDKENVVVVLLDTRMRPYAWNRVSLGTVDEANCHPREVFRPVIVGGAHGFAIMHNHPSGDPSPSRADERLTRRLVDGAQLLQLHMADHVVIGEPAPGRAAYHSFREAGMIP
jgi:DNA repair protein RadC